MLQISSVEEYFKNKKLLKMLVNLNNIEPFVIDKFLYLVVLANEGKQDVLETMNDRFEGIAEFSDDFYESSEEYKKKILIRQKRNKIDLGYHIFENKEFKHTFKDIKNHRLFFEKAYEKYINKKKIDNKPYVILEINLYTGRNIENKIEILMGTEYARDKSNTPLYKNKLLTIKKNKLYFNLHPYKGRSVC